MFYCRKYILSNPISYYPNTSYICKYKQIKWTLLNLYKPFKMKLIEKFYSDFIKLFLKSIPGWIGIAQYFFCVLTNILQFGLIKYLLVDQQAHTYAHKCTHT